MLTDYFLELHAKTFRNNPKPLSREMTRLMQRYDWPGNIRQLENMLRGYVLIGSEEVLAAELVASVPASLTRLNTEIDLTSPILLKEVTKAATQDLERQIILKVLESNGWSRRKTAKWLNISYRSLLYKLQNSQAAEFSESPLMTGILNSMANLTQTMGPPKEVGQAGVSQESAVLKRLSYIQPWTA